MKRVLFICKKRLTSHGNYNTDISSGLNVSAKLVVDMLVKNNIPAKLVNVTDNNDIDREVTAFNPTDVVIEALWVVPDKFIVLKRLHPKVNWIIRIHSEIPFLANDGIAMQWIYQYLKLPNLSISVNSARAQADLENLLKTAVTLLPNYYPVDLSLSKTTTASGLNIGCFGAIRPFKNQLAQAIAAIEFGNWLNKPVNFHVNGSRIEDMGNSNLKNLIYLFENNTPHKLVLHDWLDHDEFQSLVKTMQLVMQVSFTESFNITTADAVSNNVPVVVSEEIQWVSPIAQSISCNVPDIVTVMKRVWRAKLLSLEYLNKIGLYFMMTDARKTWLTWSNS